jgi:CRISPR-associated protein Cmr6
MKTYYLPRDLREIVEKVKGDNFSLMFTKITPFFSEKETTKPKLKDFVEKVLGVITISTEDYGWFFRNVKTLWECVNAKIFSMKTASRLVVGLGDKSVYETSIKLHRNYGIPYIPGSALKGVTKHWAILKIADKLVENVGGDFFDLAKRVQNALEKPDEKEVGRVVKEELGKLDEVIEEIKLLRRIFGTQGYRGSVTFFDAFPNPEDVALELDIMNPHYQPYYTSGDSPGDWHKPTPIFFLTVPKGVRFEFAVGGTLAEKAKDLLVEALKEFGVGAKTSLGYGKFEL